MGMTIGEKIIARAAKVDQVKAGEIHTIEVDRLMSNDGTTHLTIDMYHDQLKHPQIADKDKLVFIMDHNVPAENPKTAAAHRKMRNFAKEHEIKLYEGKGVCHQIMVENHVCPGEFIMGADSHTCTYGALGAFGTGIGCTDFLYAMVTGQSWVLVPDTIRFNLHGKLREGVYARDLMLSIIGMVGANGCNYKIMEFAGEGAHNLDIDERLVLCNLAVEAGAKTGIVEPDEKVVEYVESRGRKAENLFKSDDDAVFEKVYDINLDEIKPVVARPHQIDDVVDAKEVNDVKIDEAFLGSCNNGRIEELRVAAEILKGKKNLRILKLKNLDARDAKYDIKYLEGNVLVQELNTKMIDEMKVVTEAQPTAEQLSDMEFGMKVVKYVKSNAICIVKNGVTLAIGGGQTSRVWALENAIHNNPDKDFNGAVLASDAFFPFNDCVQVAADAGIKAIIQPGGSIRDKDSIDLCNELNIPMVFSGYRHFRH